MRLKQRTLALLLPAALCAIAIAPRAFAITKGPGTDSALPAETTQGHVRYVSGGIGHDQAQAFERAQHRYPLSLEFVRKSKPHNEFTANAKVVIRDASGKIALDTVAQGPFLLAKLPSGRYDIQATLDGRTIERHASIVKGKSDHVDFRW